MRRKLKTSTRKALLAILAILTLTVAILSFYIYKEYDYRYGAKVEKTGVIKIYPQDSFDQVAQMLEENGYIASSSSMIQTAIKRNLNSVKIGNYQIEKGESYRQLINKINAGRQTPVRLTFNNIRTLERLAGAVSRYTLQDSSTMLNHFKEEALLSGEKENYITRFIPNTYQIYWTISPEEFTEKMRVEFDKFWDENRKQKASRLNLTQQQVVTLASVVIEETKVKAEMSTVGGVYINRIGAKMPLQADPTVKFALGDFSIKRVLKKHTEHPSPYNTYLHTGLPPGPICAPPIVAIDAVLDYADKRHGYLYFCANPDFSGSHVFAKTLPQHNQNAARYHQELNRRAIR